MKIYIDSTNNQKTILKIDDKIFEKTFDSPRDQDVFRLIVDSMNSMGLSPQDITEIEVNPGPGSFTGTRVGVTLANALAFSLGLKINGQEPPIEPIYSSEPNITFPKEN